MPSAQAVIVALTLGSTASHDKKSPNHVRDWGGLLCSEIFVNCPLGGSFISCLVGDCEDSDATGTLALI